MTDGRTSLHTCLKQRQNPCVLGANILTGFMIRMLNLFRGPLSLVSTIEELLERKSSGSGLESRDYGRRDSSR
jgi:hypothetical protein